MPSLNETRNKQSRIQANLERLSENFTRRKDTVLWEGNGRKLYGGNLIEGLEKYPKQVEIGTLALMENMLNETTELANIGSFDKWSLPLVRAIFPNLILQDLVSVQPMDGPSTLIFWMKYTYGRSKGAAVAGTDMIQNPNADYASEQVDAENIGTGTGAVANFTGTLAWIPVQPGTVVITAGAQTVVDDGGGNLTGDVNPAGANTIDYTTGAFDVTFAANPALAVAVNAAYRFKMEGNTTQPEVDLTLVSKPVVAEPMVLIANWTTFAQQDLQKLQGVAADSELFKAQGAEIKAMIERRTINLILRNASLTGAAWSSTPGAGVSQLDHYQSFGTRLIENDSQIYGANGRAGGNWIVCSLGVSNVLRALSATGRFVSQGDTAAATTGPHYIGVFDNRFKVYVDPQMTANTYLMGWKNTDNMYDVGAIFAPYIMLFATDPLNYPEFRSARGLGSRYAADVVNGNFYLTGSIT